MTRHEWIDARDGTRYAVDIEGCLYNFGPDGWEMTGAVPRAGLELVLVANAAEVYRKALEPVARAYAQRGLLFKEVPVGQEWKEAIAAACLLMGIALPAESTLPALLDEDIP